MANVSKCRKRRLNFWELGVGTALALAGAYMVWQGIGYSVGTLRHMGAGFFPIIIGGALVVLTIGIMFETRYSTAPPPELPIRPLVGITAGLVVFALTVKNLGLVPSTFLLVILSMAGDKTVGLKQAVIVSAVIAVFGYLLFGVALRLSLAPFWW